MAPVSQSFTLNKSGVPVLLGITRPAELWADAPGPGPEPAATAVRMPAAMVMVTPSGRTIPSVPAVAVGTLMTPAATVIVVPSGRTLPRAPAVAAVMEMAGVAPPELTI